MTFSASTILTIYCSEKLNLRETKTIDYILLGVNNATDNNLEQYLSCTSEYNTVFCLLFYNWSVYADIKNVIDFILYK